MKAATTIILLLSIIAFKKPYETRLTAGRIIAADMDVAGNAYFVDSAYRIHKHNGKQITQVFSLSNYGENLLLDASNPVEIFVFYANSGLAVVLDNNLNPGKEISLFAENTLAPAAFGRANDGNILLYDYRSGTLKMFGLKANLIQESNVSMKEIVRPVKMSRIWDNGRIIAFVAPDSSIQVFNPNLNLVRIIAGKYNSISGLQGDNVLADNGKEILSIPVTYKNPESDIKTVLQYQPGEEVLTLNNGRVLIKTTQGLFLRP